ncbi:MAG: exonuclease subunit SbcD [Alteromonadaceae bacterium]|nr:exonuclease subunit SbcD [Alteromonadaceae bacterium]
MRIIHTSDWHLGQHFYGKSRANEHQQFLTWLLEQVKEQGVDAIIVAGDIFDTGTPPSYAREMYFDFIVNIHQLNCQLVVLAGNHDSVAMLGESRQLLGSLSTHVIPAVTDNIDQQVFALNDKEGQAKAIICAIPFIRPRDVIKSQAGQSASVKQQSLQQAISDHYQKLFVYAESLAKKLVGKSAENQQLPIIATGHLTTVGASTTDSVRDIYIGTLEAFPASAFPKADYIALGHIHRSQKVNKDDCIRYCGSPIPLSFDEVKQDKQVLLLDFCENKEEAAGNKPEIIPLVVPRFQAMAMIKTTLEDLAQDITLVVDENTVDPLTQNKIVQEQIVQNKIVQDKIWLDIEIESAGYLQDLQGRIDLLVEDLPIEILLVRRSKKSRELMPEHQKKITLNELSLDDVFETRLAQEHWDSDDELARKDRLTLLFQQAVDEVKSELVSTEHEVKA